MVRRWETDNKTIYLITAIICVGALITSTFTFLIYIEITSIDEVSYIDVIDVGKYWREYIDPFGNNKITSGVNNTKRPFPVENIIGSENTTYTITIGNILIVMYGDTNGKQKYDTHWNWLINILENNFDKNIILCTHHQTSNFTDNYMGPWFENHMNHTVVAWLQGHSHYSSRSVPQARFKNWHTILMSCGAIDYCHSGNYSHSYLWTFTEGSKIVQIGDFNHSSRSWDDPPTGPGPGNCTINMTYPFTYYETIEKEKTENFRIWISSDHHVNCNSSLLMNAIHDADTYFPVWNISLVLGDLVDGCPSIKCFQQWQIVRNNSNHQREDFYCLAGNHDDAGVVYYMKVR